MIHMYPLPLVRLDYRDVWKDDKIVYHQRRVPSATG